MRHLDLFSGIGGFALATEMVWPDVEHIFCDNDTFAQAVLKKHWPNSPIHDDIKTLRGAELGHIDLLTGGFPCQPFSAAGRRRGTEDDRHLWPEMLRVIRETNPRWVLGENVSGFLTWNGGLVFEQVCTDLEAEGYEVCPLVIPAVAVNAPHRRDRVWIAAFNSEYARRDGSENRESGIAGSNGDASGQDENEQPARPVVARDDASYAQSKRPRGEKRDVRKKERGQVSGNIQRPQSANWLEDWPSVAARLCTLDDGLPGRLARPRGWRNAALKGAGNAIVPQVAAEIMRGMKNTS